MKSLFTIPKNPVDQYHLEWYRISVTSNWCYIYHVIAIYHINTPWEKISDHKGGAPIVDEWQILNNGSFVGRLPRWQSIAEDGERWEGCFLIRQEAVDEAIRRLKEWIADEGDKIKGMERIIKELQDK